MCLVDRPRCAREATVRLNSKFVEEMACEVDGPRRAAHALVFYNTSGCYSLVRDGDCLSAVRVGVAELAHELPGKCKCVLSHGIDIGAARTKTAIIEGNFAGARRT